MKSYSTPPQFKMALFNSSQISQIYCSAEMRSREISARDLQCYSDALYNIIINDVSARRDELFNEFMETIKHANSTRSLTLPIWNYNVRYYRESKAEYNKRIGELEYSEWMKKIGERKVQDDMICDNGWHWTVGGMNAVPVPVDIIFKKTDIYQRLAISLLPDMDIIVRTRVNDIVHQTGEYVIANKELILDYYPDGIRSYWQNKVLDKARAKYKDYKTTTEIVMPRLIGPLYASSVSPPMTPPLRCQTPSSPPRLMRSSAYTETEL